MAEIKSKFTEKTSGKLVFFVGWEMFLCFSRGISLELVLCLQGQREVGCVLCAL